MGKGKWTVADLRDLLVGYPTDPDFAEVEAFGSNGLLVKLPENGGEFVSINAT